jgi:hypothetical protein
MNELHPSARTGRPADWFGDTHLPPAVTLRAASLPPLLSSDPAALGASTLLPVQPILDSGPAPRGLKINQPPQPNRSQERGDPRTLPVVAQPLVMPEVPSRLKAISPRGLPLSWGLLCMAGCMSISAPQTTFEPVNNPLPTPSSVSPAPLEGDRPAVDLGEPVASTPAPGRLGRPFPITPVPRIDGADRQETSGRRDSTATPPAKAPALPEDDPIPAPLATEAPAVATPNLNLPELTPPAAEPTVVAATPIPVTPLDSNLDSAPATPPRTRVEAVDLEVTDPPQRQVGAGATFRVKMTNRGREQLTGTRVVCEFDDGLAFGTSTDRLVSQPLGPWAAGESKELALTLGATKAGRYSARFKIQRDADDHTLVEQVATAEFVDRRYELTVVGPTERTIGSRAEFLVRVVNRSSEPLIGCELTLTRDPVLVLKELTEGSRRTGGAIRWTLEPIPPGGEALLQAEFECRSAAERAALMATLAGAGLPGEEFETGLRIAPITGVLDLRLDDVVDPVPVGETITYRLAIANLGLQEVRKLRVRLQTTEPLEVRSARVTRGQTPLDTRFEQTEAGFVGDEIDTLAADESLVIEVTAAATRGGQGELTAFVEHEVPGSATEVRETTWVTGP